MKAPLIRGLALKNDLEVARELFGDALIDDLVARMAPHHRAQAAAGFLPAKWYDEQIQIDLVIGLVAELGMEAIGRLGVALGQRTVTRWHRFLSRVVGPERLLARAPGMWRYWRDTGHMRVARHAHGEAEVIVSGNPLFATDGNAELYGAAAAYMVHVAGGKATWIGVTRDDGDVVAHVRWNGAPRPSTVPTPGFEIDAVLASLPASFR